MKQVFQCDYCEYRGLAEDVAKHEAECENSPDLRTCNTCIYASGNFIKVTCLKGVDVPIFSIKRGCSTYNGKEA
jgi:hypothetical protein